jgi:hypothetical protein
VELGFIIVQGMFAQGINSVSFIVEEVIDGVNRWK